jgi:microcystin-dependent protein
MSDPFVAEIRMFPGNFAPKGWAFCNGQLLPISQNTTLFSLLGTTYGGNGTSNFALPDLQGRAPMHPGQGPGLSLRDLGEEGGQETVTLAVQEIPLHNHTANASTNPTNTQSPAGAVWSKEIGAGFLDYGGLTGNNQMSPAALAPTGGGQPHQNMQPYLTVNFIIALQGVFPPRP